MERNSRMPVEGRADLKRDVVSKAIICTDNHALEKARKLKAIATQNRAKTQSMESRINNLEEGMGRIENLLTKVLEKLGDGN